MTNIRAITTHFTTKIEETCHGELQNLTEQEVLNIVRANYETLTLKLQENLDTFEKYKEKPKEVLFFVQLVKLVAIQSRQSLEAFSLDHQAVLNEFSTIH